mgnify:CR=1 FL=1
MTIPTHRDAEAALRRLAEATVECPGCDADLIIQAQSYHGHAPGCTGRVARFPMLRRVCAYPLHDAISCWRCDSLGWLPLELGEVTIELALAAARSQGWDVAIDSFDGEVEIELRVPSPVGKRSQPTVKGHAGEERETLLLALDAAMEGKA